MTKLFNIYDALTDNLVDGFWSREASLAAMDAYTTETGRSAYMLHEHSDLDDLVIKYSAFPSFQALVNAAGGYRPTIRCYDSRVWSAAEMAELVVLADAYDAFQEARGDDRRAYRGSQYVPPAPAPEEIDEPEEIKPATLKAGDQVSLFRNQGDRDGWVLAVLGATALVEYEMPSGVTYLNLVPSDNSDAWYKTVSHRALSRVWREEIAVQGGRWAALERRGRMIVSLHA